MKRFVCEDCDWRGEINDALKAPNPFDSKEEIIGCPNCKSVNSMRYTCDEPDCWLEISVGTPTANGYRQTCSKHKPQEEGNANTVGVAVNSASGDGVAGATSEAGALAADAALRNLGCLGRG